MAPTPTETEPPDVSIEYDGHLYPGTSFGYSWRYPDGAYVHADTFAWQYFDEIPALKVNRGEEVSFVVSNASDYQGTVTIQVSPVLVKEPVLDFEAEVGVTAGLGTRNLPPGVYGLHWSYRGPRGGIDYRFKVEIVE